MYKITVRKSKVNSLKIITVFKEEQILGFNYWNAVERVLCSTKFVENHTDHFISKYNIVAEQNDYSILEKMQSVG